MATTNAMGNVIRAVPQNLVKFRQWKLANKLSQNQKQALN